MAIGICGLCKKQANLEISHLIPRFVAKRLKADSPAPFLRNVQDPNKRLQDSLKRALLCRECEERFGVFEEIFARDIFRPTMNGETLTDFRIGEEHRRFCATIAWRNLAVVLLDREAGDSGDDDYSAEDWTAIAATEVVLRDALLANTPIPDEIEFHLFCGRSTTETEFDGMNALTNLTAGFALNGHAECDDRLYSIGFMNGLILITLIRADDECRQQWSNGSTLVAPGALWSNHHQRIEDPYLGGVLIALADDLSKSHDSMNEAQHAVVAASVKKADPKKWAESQHGQAVIQDYLNRKRKGNGS